MSFESRKRSKKLINKIKEIVELKQWPPRTCVVTFKDKLCEVYYRGALVLTGKDIGPGGLWILPIDGRANLDEETPATKQNPPNIAATTLYTLPYK